MTSSPRNQAYLVSFSSSFRSIIGLSDVLLLSQSLGFEFRFMEMELGPDLEPELVALPVRFRPAVPMPMLAGGKKVLVAEEV
jgi:hypothetical protein